MTVIYFSKELILTRLENKAFLPIKVTAFELPLASLKQTKKKKSAWKSFFPQHQHKVWETPCSGSSHCLPPSHSHLRHEQGSLITYVWCSAPLAFKHVGLQKQESRGFGFGHFRYQIGLREGLESSCFLRIWDINKKHLLCQIESLITIHTLIKFVFFLCVSPGILWIIWFILISHYSFLYEGSHVIWRCLSESHL